ncbi:hypothetical protein B0T24DRAFT_673866 [Lasiosphaeria ovina]|uniref:Uncharacterized protein n=1 Tax=Lasiosphaeria ovina TaxID=92902 RepID=A0AAE0NM37_9PEZI|nr:hypothetical protein B0T24DRAFT_673866 [Lasiosphaeria ovina]
MLPVGRRMAWAARRQTSRVEDRAYSFLGLFNVHMPMQYGEGEAAFTQLQEAIIAKYADLSLFAWQPTTTPVSKYLGLLAESPDNFETCFDLERIDASIRPFAEMEFSVTNCGVSISELRLTGILGRGGTDGCWSLGHGHASRLDEAERNGMELHLRKVGPKTFVRLAESPHRPTQARGRYGEKPFVNLYSLGSWGRGSDVPLFLDEGPSSESPGRLHQSVTLRNQDVLHGHGVTATAAIDPAWENGAQIYVVRVNVET